MKYFEVNMLVALDVPDTEPAWYRILHIDQQNNHLFGLPMPHSARAKHQHGVPIEFNFEEMQRLRSIGQCEIILNDPWLAVERHEKDLSDAQKKKLEKNWKLLAPLLEIPKLALFQRSTRGTLIKQIAERELKPTATIYRLLERYWRRGQSKAALIPDFQNQGNRGQSKLAKPDGPKRGRRRRTTRFLDAHPGINITEEIKQKLVQMGREYYEKERLSLTKAYEEGLKKYFKIGWIIKTDGSRQEQMPPEHELPTFTQFRYWYSQDRALNFERVQVARLGANEYNLTSRPLSGDASYMASGPGQVFQVDATVPGLYLVSSRNPQLIIGKAVVYGISDTFSRMVVAFWVGLEGPSWAGAIQALVNMTENKVAFCKSLGIEIDESDWPCHHLPEAILADRGEFEGYNASQLVTDFNVRVSNTAPYRADWKGVIERTFGHLDTKLVDWLDGAVRINRRGERDHRLEATLTLKEFRTLLALHFIEFNSAHEMTKYPRELEMIRDEVRPIPLDLWNWGLANRSGALKKVDPDALRIKLLPRDWGSVTRKGIKFKNHYYTCTVIENEQWREKATRQGMTRVSLAYDTWSSGTVYVQHPDTKEFMLCSEVQSVDSTGDVPWAELELETELDRLRRDEAEPALKTRQRNFQHQKQQITQAAKARAKAATSTESKSARLDQIKENRVSERALEREQQLPTESGVFAQGKLEPAKSPGRKMFAVEIDELLAGLSKAKKEK